MNLEQYVKLRCDLNNRDYKEVRDRWDSSSDSSFKVEKLVKDENEKIKYCIKYIVKDYGEAMSKDIYRYNATVTVTFFVQREVDEEQTKFMTQKYDTVSMYYHFSYYQHPSVVEKLFEDAWSKLGVFANDPYLKSPT